MFMFIHVLCYDLVCFNSIWLDMGMVGIVLRLYSIRFVVLFLFSPYLSIVLNSFFFFTFSSIWCSHPHPHRHRHHHCHHHFGLVGCCFVLCMCKFINLVYLDGAPKEQIVKKSNLPISYHIVVWIRGSLSNFFSFFFSSTCAVSLFFNVYFVSFCCCYCCAFSTWTTIESFFFCFLISYVLLKFCKQLCCK